VVTVGKVVLERRALLERWLLELAAGVALAAMARL